MGRWAVLLFWPFAHRAKIKFPKFRDMDTGFRMFLYPHLDIFDRYLTIHAPKPIHQSMGVGAQKNIGEGWLGTGAPHIKGPHEVPPPK